MNEYDTGIIADVIVAAVKSATAPLLERLAALEARPFATKELWDELKDQTVDFRSRLKAVEAREPLVGPAGRDGIDGRPTDPALIKALIDAGVHDAVSALPTPKDGKDGERGEKGLDGAQGEPGASIVGPAGTPGRDGTDGASADPEHVKAVILEAVAALPIPKDGQPGKDGQDGASVTVAQLAPVIEAEVAKTVACIPRAKDGVGIQHATIDNSGRLVFMLTDGSSRDVGIVKGDAGEDGRDGIVGQAGRDGKEGEPGQDGKDGLGFDDVQVEHDGHGGFTIKFIRGDRQKTFGTFKVPRFEYHGVYQPGKSYETGDAATWAGSLWIAKASTSTKPGDGSPDWQLAVKRGADGRDAKK